MQTNLLSESNLPTQPRQKNARWVAAKDCRKYTATMDDSGISLIVTDPPYFIDGMGDDWNNDTLGRRLRPSGVVGSLPIGMKFYVTQGTRLWYGLQCYIILWIGKYAKTKLRIGEWRSLAC